VHGDPELLTAEAVPRSWPALLRATALVKVMSGAVSAASTMAMPVQPVAPATARLMLVISDQRALDQRRAVRNAPVGELGEIQLAILAEGKQLSRRISVSAATYGAAFRMCLASAR